MRKGGTKATGVPALAELVSELRPGELSKMRDTMRKVYCDNSASSGTGPCKFLAKLRAAHNAEEKKVVWEEHKKGLAAHPPDNTEKAMDFFVMFEG